MPGCYRALTETTNVAHAARYAPLMVSAPTRFGADTMVPLRVDRSIGAYVFRSATSVENAAALCYKWAPPAATLLSSHGIGWRRYTPDPRA